MQEQLTVLDKRIDHYDERIQRLARQDAQAARLMALPGVGPLTATAFVAAVGDPRHFPAGRNVSANLGLTPHEHSPREGDNAAAANNSCSAFQSGEYSGPQSQDKNAQSLSCTFGFIRN